MIADTTPIITPNKGWITHGELKIGDYVFTPEGNTAPVKDISEEKLCNFEINFRNGEIVSCSGDHEWIVFGNSRQDYKIFETSELAQKKLLQGKDSASKYFLPKVQPLEFPNPPELTMDAYTLGIWLGDGTKTAPRISHSSKDQGVVEKIEKAGYNVSDRYIDKTTGKIITYFADGSLYHPGRMTRELTKLGLIIKVGSIGWKFIPEQYFKASIEDRLELLAGLIDSSGHVAKNGQCTFSTTNIPLAEGVIDLTTTLGFRPSLSVLTPKYNPNVENTKLPNKQNIQKTKRSYKIRFRPTMTVPTYISRKQITPFNSQPPIGIRRVEHEPNGGLGRSIKVGSKDGLYLIKNKLTPVYF